MLCKLVILIYTNSNTHLGKISGFDFIAQMRGMILVSSYCIQFVWPNRPQRRKGNTLLEGVIAVT